MKSLYILRTAAVASLAAAFVAFGWMTMGSDDPHMARDRIAVLLEILVTIAQAGSALFLAYGCFLVLMPARKAAKSNPSLEDEFLLRRHILTDV
jgi:hypothetical protein